MEKRQIKAYGFRGTLEFIDQSYDAAARGRILGAMSPEARDYAEHKKKEHFADPLHSCELWAAMVKEHPDKEEARKQLVRCGRHMGSYATSTYLRLLMKVLTMKLFARKFPDIWARDANFGKLALDSSEIETGKLRIQHSELGSYPFFGPVCEGWYAFSFETMGLKNVTVTSVGWSMDEPDRADLDYRVAWVP